MIVIVFVTRKLFGKFVISKSMHVGFSVFLKQGAPFHENGHICKVLQTHYQKKYSSQGGWYAARSKIFVFLKFISMGNTSISPGTTCPWRNLLGMSSLTNTKTSPPFLSRSNLYVIVYPSIIHWEVGKVLFNVYIILEQYYEVDQIYFGWNWYWFVWS